MQENPMAACAVPLGAGTLWEHTDYVLMIQSCPRPPT